MILLKVSYRVRAHVVADFEKAFRQKIMPVVRERGLRLRGVWKTVVGNAGEYLELWEFDSMAEFERKWQGLMADPRLLEAFQTTGPMVEQEVFSLFEPLPLDAGPADSGRFTV